MTTAVQVWLSDSFHNFANTFASSYTGGIFNLIFVPVTNETTRKTTLQFASFSAFSNLSASGQFLLNPLQSLSVWSVLPKESQFAPVKNNTYWLLLILLVLAWLIALVITCVLLVYSCRNGRRRSNKWDHKKKMAENGYEAPPSQLDEVQKNKWTSGCNQGTLYLSLGILCAIELVILFCLCVLAFYSVSTLNSPGKPVEARRWANVSQSGGADGSNSTKLSVTLGVALDQMQLFLQSIVPDGLNATDRTVSKVNRTTVKNLKVLVRDILSLLLASYRVQPLQDQADELSAGLLILKNTTGYILNDSNTVLNEISEFEGAMKGYQEALRKDFGVLCGKLNTSLANSTCFSLQSQISVLKYSFNRSAILTEPIVALSEINEIFGVNLTELVSRFKSLHDELNKEADGILQKVVGQFDLSSLFNPLKQLWTNMSTELQPTLKAVQSSRPTVETAADAYQTAVTAFGYVVIVLCLVLLVILTVYLLIYGVECHERSLLTGTKSSLDPVNPTTDISKDNGIPTNYPQAHNSPKWILIIMAIFAVIICLLIIIWSAMILITVIAVNDICRYGTTPMGQNQTDAVFNLYLKSIWPNLIGRFKLSSQIESMVQLPAPSNVLQALLVQCPNKTHLGLLPLVGLNNVVNVTGVLQSSNLQKIMNDKEQTLVDEILKINFSSYIPTDLDKLFTTIENMTSYLDNMDYSETVKQLTTPPMNITASEIFVQSLITFAQPLAETDSNARSILTTAHAIRDQLKRFNSTYQKAYKLGQAFTELQKQRTLTRQLQAIRASLVNLTSILRNSTLVEKPIRPAYRSGTSRFLGNISADLEVDMTQFTGALFACNRLSAAASITVDVLCANSAVIHGLGSFALIAFALSFILLITFSCYQSFVWLHQKHCLLATGQGIPLYLFVRYVHKRKTG
ncbi:hypothetical protein D915_007071 [Fasciola hepatica]|uniref:Uncharacterized protein n=1 Tax=Fasciola hepatica TaxID=6192 RepID=A0A4E0R2G7_FASHE|nr:hypothetical protein D915_007071 [Fasciola hepatica]